MKNNKDNNHNNISLIMKNNKHNNHNDINEQISNKQINFQAIICS